MTVDEDFIISEKLYLFLQSRGVLIENLKRIKDWKNHELPFYHLYTELTFPKFLPSSEGLIIENQCPVCKRNGYYCDAKIGDAKKGIPTIITPLRLKYEGISKEFLESSDLFNTWEHLGVSNLKVEGIKGIVYSRPMLIVSERIKKAFEEYGIKNAVFDEVIIY